MAQNDGKTGPAGVCNGDKDKVHRICFKVCGRVCVCVCVCVCVKMDMWLLTLNDLVLQLLLSPLTVSTVVEF